MNTRDSRPGLAYTVLAGLNLLGINTITAGFRELAGYDWVIIPDKDAEKLKPVV